MYYRFFLTICAIYLGVSSPALSFAQDIPPSADPSRSLPTPKTDTKSLETLPSEKHIFKAPELPPEIADKDFTLKTLSITGLTAFPKKDIEVKYAPYIGKTISVEKLYEIVNSLQQKYFDAGYAFTNVSLNEQSIGSGDIEINITEGYIDEIELDPKIEDLDLISDFSNQIKAMKPLNSKKLERLMLLINDRPGLDIVAVLAEPINPHTTPGAMRLILKENTNSTKNNKVSAQIAFDNFGSNYVGPGQISSLLRFYNLGNSSSDLLLNFKTVTSVKDLLQIGATYTQPIFGLSGINFTLSGQMSHSEPGDKLENLLIKGNSESLMANLTYSLVRQRSTNLIVNTSLSAINNKTTLLGETVANDRIRSLGFGLNYSGVDQLNGLNVIQLNYTKGLNILGATESGSLNLSRKDGRSDFQKYEVSASRLQSLGGNFDFYASIQGQYSDLPLLSSQEYGFGGELLGRGYDASEITGDRGMASSLELRYSSRVPQYMLNMQSFLFYDVGKVWNIDASDSNSFSAASTGLGTRIIYDNQWSITAVIAYPLTKKPESPPKYNSDGNMRILFGISKSF